MNEEITAKIKKKLAELEAKVNNFNIQKFVLNNIADESSKKTNIKLSNILQGVDLHDEISYINDWVEFHSKEIERCRAKLKRLEQAKEGQIKDSFKLVFKDAEKPFAIREKLNINEIIAKFSQKRLFKYAIPIIVLLLITTSLFLFKPSLTGYVALTKEAIYKDNLNLNINETGTYEWQPENIGNIKSIKASGSVEGNGSVKIYIEKDGKRYLIYKNE